jgi:hypothetical protein
MWVCLGDSSDKLFQGDDDTGYQKFWAEGYKKLPRAFTFEKLEGVTHDRVPERKAPKSMAVIKQMFSYIDEQIAAGGGLALPAAAPADLHGSGGIITITAVRCRVTAHASQPSRHVSFCVPGEKYRSQTFTDTSMLSQTVT